MGDRGVIRSLFGMKYSTVKLTDTAFCFSPHRPAPLRVILSEAAHRVQRRTRPPTIAAQSNPAPLAGRQQAGSPLFKRTRVTHTVHRGHGQRVVRGVMYYARLFRPHPALARHLPPRRGRLFSAVQIFPVLLHNFTGKSALYLTVTSHRSSLPLRGGRWRASAG